MRQAEYILEKHTMAGIQEREKFVGTRPEARMRCAEKDIDEEGKRLWGQTTAIRFVRYTDD